MKKIISTVVALFIASLVLPLCRCTSPLSDVDITDFSIIGATITMTKYLGGLPPAYKSVQARINDKNGASVKIRNGGVTVNGTAMTYDSSTFVQSYVIENFPMIKNTTYRFIISVSNGDQCTSTVTTPPAEFGTVTVPDSFSLSQGATVTWTDVAQGSPLDVKLRQYSSNRYIFERLGMPDSGRVVMQPVVDTTLAGNASLMMTRSAIGNAAPQLRSGSSIKAEYFFSKDVKAVK
jgi:hypothetical protein